MARKIKEILFNTKRYLLAGAGTVSLILGILGIFLPLLPTTPFLLLTAYCYLKSSPKLYNWLISQPRLGPYILNFQTYKVIPIRAKISAISLLWASILFCIFFVVNLLWVRILLLGIAIGVTIHILSYKSQESGVKNQEPENKSKEGNEII